VSLRRHQACGSAAASSKASVSPQAGRLPSTGTASSVPVFPAPGLRLGPSVCSACAWLERRPGIVSSMPPAPRCLHTESGFQRSFTLGARGPMARPERQGGELAAHRSRTLRPNAARRLLQPEEPASTTLEPSDPQHVRPKGASDLRRTGRKLREGLGPLPPLRPSPPGGAKTGPPASGLATFCRRIVWYQPRFPRSGADQLSPPGNSCSARRQARSLTPTSSARAPLVTRLLLRWQETPTPSLQARLTGRSVREHKDVGLCGLRAVRFRETDGLTDATTRLHGRAADQTEHSPALTEECPGPGPPHSSPREEA